MAEGQTVTAAVLVIGNEILSGRTKDANLAYLGENLDRIGIRLMEARVVADDQDAIARALNSLRANYDYVFTTGGIGPTHDDITAESVAKAFDLPLIQHPEARAILEASYPPGELNAARLRMANTPEGARLVENPISWAPGFQIENVFVLAGIPKVMQAMFQSLAPGLTGSAPLLTESLDVHLPEGRMAAGLGVIQGDHPDLEIGSYPFHREGIFGARIVLRGVDPASLSTAFERLKVLVSDLQA